MRLIHTSDWHLGQYFYGKSRANEHQAFLTWLVEQAITHQVDAIIVAGDIFDTANPPSYAREMYFDFIAKVSQLNCQLILLAGNHDSVAMLGESKQVLAYLNSHIVTHIDSNQAQNIVINNSAGEPVGVISAIPFIRPRDVVKSIAGLDAQAKQQQLQQAIADQYLHHFEQAKTCTSGNALPIVGTGHLTTVGASTSDSVREIYIGTLDAFPADAFPPYDYLALGHIHQSQKIAKSEHIRYCGSPIALSFDEARQEKFVHLVDVTNERCEVERLTVPTTQQLLMVKKPVEQLKAILTEHIALLELSEEQLKDKPIWLDVEVDSDEYHHDISQRIEQHLSDMPVEVLRVRRSKSQRKILLEQQEKITLEELDVDEVFKQRLSLEREETIDSAESADQQERLMALYKSVVEQVHNEEEL
ncbi:exonuclease subunit SbcD [Thalassotalea sp. LPB0316]|uniref:exonuclease subunit SbcD n=1 Tax=Thalassotalea sp. LPB0316 TaxID=2769490 RepID=UPI001868EFD3|nr:exonuclease subunit SbcD [Thalassotalea sp. LPB0316]QOL24740.1 exonuclease subunit SbcD [Thalassotalea sp. LPB0316]